VADAAVEKLLRIFSVVAAEKTELLPALALDFPDFEDAVQAACAVKVSADWVVTRNIRDFKKSPIAGRPPGAVLAPIRASTG
jgi:hypothetical protein